MGAQLGVCQAECEKEMCAPECCVVQQPAFARPNCEHFNTYAPECCIAGQQAIFQRPNFEHFDLRAEPNYLQAETSLDDDGLRTVAGQLAERPEVCGGGSRPSPSRSANWQKRRPEPLQLGRGDAVQGGRSGSTPLSSRSGQSGSQPLRRMISGNSSHRSSPRDDGTSDGWRQDGTLDEDFPGSVLPSSRNSSRNSSRKRPSSEQHQGLGLGNLSARNHFSNRSGAIKGDPERPSFTLLPGTRGPLTAANLTQHSASRGPQGKKAMGEAQPKPPDIRWATSDARERVNFSDGDRMAKATGPVRVWSDHTLQDADVDVDIYMDEVPEGGASSVGVALRKSPIIKGEPGEHLGRCKGSIGLLLFTNARCDIEKEGKKVQMSVCKGVQTGSTVTIHWDGHSRTVQFAVDNMFVGSPLAVPNGDYVFAASLKEKSSMKITDVRLIKHR